MSIRVMSYVWEQSTLGGTELLCLLAIADFADDDGTAYPSVATLAGKIRMSERNTHYLISKLVDSGELMVERNAGPKGCNLFRVQCLQGVQPVAGGGATGSARGVQPIAPEPSLNRQRTVNYAKKPQAKRPKRRIDPAWEPSEATVETVSREFGLRVPEDVRKYVAAFRDACQAKDYQYADFDAAFRNCVRQDWGRLREKQTKPRVSEIPGER